MKKRNLSGSALIAAGLFLAVRPATAQFVSTLAGSGTAGSMDGAGAHATFQGPMGVSVDPRGNVYVADTSSLKIRKISPDGRVTTVAGDGSPGYGDGVGAKAEFFGPLGVATDAFGNVWIADQDDGIDGQSVKKITPDGVVHNLPLYPGSDPIALAVDSTGSLFVGDAYAGIWKISADGTATSIATGIEPTGVAVDGVGNVYVAESKRRVILKITQAGNKILLAGSGVSGRADGTGAAASFCGPSGLAVDASGNVYVADSCNNEIRKITPAGIVTTVAGSAGAGRSDGTGPAAAFRSPAGVALDAAGNVYVADSGNNWIRKITSQGVIDISVRSDDRVSLLRFDGPTGTMSLDSQDEDGFPASGKAFGPYPGWTPRAVDSGLDGLTRVLWNNTDGSAALWLVGSRGNEASFRLGPVLGATAADVAAAEGGATRILWTYVDGRLAVWTVERTGRVFTGPDYGPVSGWTARAISEGRDSLSRILWVKEDGLTGLWLLGRDGVVNATRMDRPAGAAAADLAAGADGATRILWTYPDGSASVSSYDPTAAHPRSSGPIYNPPFGFTAVRVAAGSDGLSRVLWRSADARTIVWILSADNIVQTSFGLEAKATD